MFVFFREFFVLLSFINFAVRGMKTRQQGELVVQTFNVAVCKEIVPFVVFNKPRNVRGEGGQVFDISVYAAALPQLFELDCRYKTCVSLHNSRLNQRRSAGRTGRATHQ